MDEARDADAEGDFAAGGYGYLDSGTGVGCAGFIFAGASIVFIVRGVGTLGRGTPILIG